MAKDIFEMAWDVVNPDGEKTSDMQENEVQALVNFAESVLKEHRPTSRALDEVHAERTMSMSCPSCHRLIEVVLLASLRQ